MTESEAKGFVQGKLDCMEKCDVFNREDKHRNNECDNCEYCYSQGNFGEQKEAFQMAIKALEKQIPKKIVKHDKCPVCNNNQSTTWYYVGASYCEYCGQKLSWESDTD